jgi:SAM-dependent methyltransferase
MNVREIKKMKKFEQTYWWHIGKKNLVIDLARKYLTQPENKIMEIGSGAGEITHVLTQFGDVYANDISKEALDFCSSKGVKNVILGNINEIDLSSYSEEFDAIFALDVLEHIQDDVKTIKLVSQLLKEDGLFFINVPAFKFLWSSHDEALEHKRRYTSYEIITKLKENGFEILKSSHFVFFVFPVVAAFKFSSNFIGKNAYPKASYIRLPNILNSLMIGILNLESKLMKYINLPFGTTITIVAQKN